MAKQERRSRQTGGGLEIEQDLPFQQRVWTTQRIGWIVMAVLVIAASVGLFGTGPVSNSSVASPGLEVEYERFGRLQQPTTIRFRVDADTNETAKIFVGRKYLESVQVEQITPEPDKVEAAAQWFIYSFTRQGPTAVTFHVRPDEFGVLSGEARLAQGETIAFWQLIYP
jgi:hypothetical protein